MRILLNEIYSQDLLLEEGYRISDMEKSGAFKRCQANLFKGKELIGRIRDAGNFSWRVLELEVIGKMVPGELYEGSAEKTVILQCIESIGDFTMQDLLKKDPQLISNLVSDLWNDDSIWEEFDSRIAEEVEKFKQSNPGF